MCASTSSTAAPRRGGRRWSTCSGALLLLLPMCAAIGWAAWPYVAQAWAVREGSRETSGLPGVYLLKSVILVFAVQLALQGVAMALRAALVLRGGPGDAAEGAAAP